MTPRRRLVGLPAERLAQGFNSSTLDQPAGLPPADFRYLICSTQRSGSYYLCQLLSIAGLGLPHEYFQPLFLQRGHQRFDVPLAANAAHPRYFDALLSRRSRNGVFGAKVQMSQLLRFLRGPAGRELLASSRLIYLYRENLVDQAISLHCSMLTGDWGISGDARTFKMPPPGAFMNMQALSGSLQRITAEDAAWRRLFAELDASPLWLSTELLLLDRAGQVGRLVSGLGFEADEGELQRFLDAPSLIPPAVRAQTPPREKIRQAFVDYLRRNSVLAT